VYVAQATFLAIIARQVGKLRRYHLRKLIALQDVSRRLDGQVRRGTIPEIDAARTQPVRSVHQVDRTCAVLAVFLNVDKGVGNQVCGALICGQCAAGRDFGWSIAAAGACGDLVHLIITEYFRFGERDRCKQESKSEY